MKIIMITIILLSYLGIGVVIGNTIWGDNPSIAPTYALNNECSDYPNHCLRLDFKPFFNIQNSNDFWQEATKNTTFTIDEKPVEITDIQIFYKQESSRNHAIYRYINLDDWLLFLKSHPNANFNPISDWYQSADGSWTLYYTEPITTYGNITYYPLGIENGQTYTAPTPTPTPIPQCYSAFGGNYWCCIKENEHWCRIQQNQ